MPYNKAKAEKKWKNWKQREEDILRKLGVEEETIMLLHEFDWNQFKEDRRFNERQWTYEESYFVKTSESNDKLSCIKLDQLLNSIENVNLFKCVASTDSITKSIIVLKVNDFTIKDISIILHISPNVIYKRIYRLRKKYKKMAKK
ncbi:sigma-70 family RNA polymerase sigma factor [Faecalicoccus pleomorphus]|uniref:Sigma-70 family RNA polymerase sigma factor n=1 Tax=Faecalicoccus pleomorphus TaxID=1323 RepID=A0A7X9RJ54_9FIRM|nr:sigma-70 family RNA polymerase sigma factor [Faecalicoccus pleomorphus]NME43884.1 sigma-70 family RNA polymerase sigma factor [Faecalicoccus pleomorphus]